MHHARAYFGIAFDQLRKEVYVLGGYNRGYLNHCEDLSHCEKFNTLTGEWIVIAPMNKKKDGVSACIFNSQFVFAIGCYKTDIEKYSIETDSWENIKISGDL